MLTPCQLYTRSKTITPLRYADRPARAGLFPHWRPGPNVIQSGTANSSSVKNARRSAELLREDGTLNDRCARCAGRERNLSPVFRQSGQMNLVFAHGSASFPFECANAAIYAAEMPSGEHLTAQEWVDSDSRTAPQKGKEFGGPPRVCARQPASIDLPSQSAPTELWRERPRSGSCSSSLHAGMLPHARMPIVGGVHD